MVVGKNVIRLTVHHVGTPKILQFCKVVPEPQNQNEKQKADFNSKTESTATLQ